MFQFTVAHYSNPPVFQFQPRPHTAVFQPPGPPPPVPGPVTLTFHSTTASVHRRLGDVTLTMTLSQQQLQQLRSQLNALPH